MKTLIEFTLSAYTQIIATLYIYKNIIRYDSFHS